jgi:hypothetical protein
MSNTFHNQSARDGEAISIESENKARTAAQQGAGAGLDSQAEIVPLAGLTPYSRTQRPRSGRLPTVLRGSDLTARS